MDRRTVQKIPNFIEDNLEIIIAIPKLGHTAASR